MLSEKPVYNLKVVLRETGIKPDVLRAWERRYGLPMPQRSAGGHRLYSQHDIAIIKWLIARQHEGLSISSAVELFREQEASSGNPLEYFEIIEQPTQLTVFASGSTLEAFRQKWLEACTSFNESAAEQILNQAFSLYPVEMVVSQVIQLGMRDLGENWFNRDVSVQQEHFTSAIALRRLETLIAATPPPTQHQTILLACPSGEWHTFSLVILNLFLRRKGFHVVFLGANVPNENLLETINDIRPALTILASQQLASAANLQRAARSLSENKLQVAYGGRVFNSGTALRDRIPAHFLGATIEDSLLMIDNLVRLPMPVPRTQDIPADYQELASEFMEKRGLIETTTMEELKLHGVPTNYIATANFHLGNELSSALELGSIGFLTDDMAWLKGLLSRHNLPEEQLNPYLITYGESMQKVMNGHSTLFKQWVNSIL
jgi:MerR family transcriptional regulator, light-induced transcriptional regulator